MVALLLLLAGCTEPTGLTSRPESMILADALPQALAFGASWAPDARLVLVAMHENPGGQAWPLVQGLEARAGSDGTFDGKGLVWDFLFSNDESFLFVQVDGAQTTGTPLASSPIELSAPAVDASMLESGPEMRAESLLARAPGCLSSGWASWYLEGGIVSWTLIWRGELYGQSRSLGVLHSPQVASLEMQPHCDFPHEKGAASEVTLQPNQDFEAIIRLDSMHLDVLAGYHVDSAIVPGLQTMTLLDPSGTEVIRSVSAGDCGAGCARSSRHGVDIGHIVMPGEWTLRIEGGGSAGLSGTAYWCATGGRDQRPAEGCDWLVPRLLNP